ncbi:MAG TPA: hypothetical protein VIQ53_04575, partial [Inquilinus sp.]
MASYDHQSSRRSTVHAKSLARIRMELARTPDAPEGARDCGYELIAPLDPDGYLDAEAWRARRGEC